MSIPLQLPSGRTVYLHPPSPADLHSAVARIRDGTYPTALIPPRGAHRIRSDNAPWILGCWLQGSIARELAHANLDALMLMVEAYLCRVDTSRGLPLTSYEQACCDGSTGVPDNIIPLGVWCKDPDSMAHDYAFDLHHAGVPTAVGKVWTLHEANDAYRDIRRAAGLPISAAIRRFGLWLFSSAYWDNRRSRHGLSPRVG